MTSEYLRLVDRAQSDKLIEQALRSDRRRAHMLLHQDHSDSVQRLLVAFVEGTYVQLHCHPEQWEMDIPLRGVLKLLIFSPEGTVLRRQDLRPGETDVAQVPAGVWHTVIAATPTALMLEAKPGPYRPAQFATWAPGETDPRSGAFVSWLAAALPGMSP
jgi:cupin fold WbuC family metalloprotein